MDRQQVIDWVNDPSNKYYKSSGHPQGQMNIPRFRSKIDGAEDFYQSVLMLTRWLDSLEPKLHFRVKCLLAGIEQHPTCKMCDNLVKPYWKTGSVECFNTYCSIKCSRSDPINQEARKATCERKYGVANPLHTDQAKANSEKAKKTLTFDTIKQRVLHHYGEKFQCIDEGFEQHRQLAVKCLDHDIVFRPRLQDLSRGNTNCPACRADNLRSQSLLSREEVIEAVRQVKGQEMFLVGEYRGMHHECEFWCVYHGSFYKKPLYILQDQNCPYCYVGTSREEAEVVNYIRQHVDGKRFETNKRGVIGKLEVDAIVDDVMVEYNGLYWHSHEKKGDKRFHIRKTERAEELGYTLYHIWSHEWKDPIKNNIWKSILKNALDSDVAKIYARKCSVQEVDNKTYHVFMDLNHLQGYSPASIRLGLYYEDTLVAMMSFSKDRFSSNNDYEMIRFATKLNHRVTGGASKLFKQFERIVGSGKKVVSYADRRMSRGKLYQQLGFTHSHNSQPNYFYTKDFKNTLSRYQCQKHKLKEFLVDFDPEMSEAENMRNNKYHKVYDSGNMVWLYVTR